MRSHIHAWNMAWGWLVERNIWFNPIYGRVEPGRTWIDWIFHMLIRAIFLSWSMITITCYYKIFMDDFSWSLFWSHVGYILGYMMCSRYGSCSWFDSLLNGWWMHGITSVVARGHWSFLVILWWGLEVYDHIWIHDLWLICLPYVWQNVYHVLGMFWWGSCSSFEWLALLSCYLWLWRVTHSSRQWSRG